ncbi:MAG: hypothetical protein KGH92_08165, partial [Xanthomonadaceae bacterium]|nr:hypothetical protein [Xanthomonadaceae bacterium]
MTLQKNAQPNGRIDDAPSRAWTCGRCVNLIAILFFMFAAAQSAIAFELVPSDIYSSNYFSLTIDHYTPAGSYIDSFSLPPSIGSEARGMAFG